MGGCQGKDKKKGKQEGDENDVAAHQDATASNAATMAVVDADKINVQLKINNGRDGEDGKPELGEEGVRVGGEVAGPPPTMDKKVSSQSVATSKGLSTVASRASMATTQHPFQESDNEMCVNMEEVPNRVSSLLMGDINVQLSGMGAQRAITLHLFTDEGSVKERISLRDHLYTKLLNVCDKRDFSLFLVDINPVPSSLTSSLTSSQLHHNKLTHSRDYHLSLSSWTQKHIKESSNTVIYLIVLNNNVLDSFLPGSISEPDFKSLHTQLKDVEKELLSKWYIPNKGCSPYLLQHPYISSQEGSERNISEVLDVLRRCWGGDEEMRLRYLKPVLLQEVESVLSGCEGKRIRGSDVVLVEGDEVDVNGDEAYTEWVRGEVEDVRRRLVACGCQLVGEMKGEFVESVEKILSPLVVDVMKNVEQDEMKERVRGISRDLLVELEEQTRHAHAVMPPTPPPSLEPLLTQIEEYVTGDSSHPVVVGVPGGGVGPQLAAMMWSRYGGWMSGVRERRHTPVCVARFVGATRDSGNLRRVLLSICQHICIIYSKHLLVASKVLIDAKSIIHHILKRVTADQPLLILLEGVGDGEDGVGLDWLPHTLPDHVKIIVTTSAQSSAYSQFQEVVGKDHCILLPAEPGHTSPLVHSLQQDLYRLCESRGVGHVKPPSPHPQPLPNLFTLFMHTLLDGEGDSLPHLISSSSHGLVDSIITRTLNLSQTRWFETARWLAPYMSRQVTPRCHGYSKTWQHGVVRPLTDSEEIVEVNSQLFNVLGGKVAYHALRAGLSGVEDTYLFNIEWLMGEVEQGLILDVVEDLEMSALIHHRDRGGDVTLLTNLLILSHYQLTQDPHQLPLYITLRLTTQLASSSSSYLQHLLHEAQTRCSPQTAGHWSPLLTLTSTTLPTLDPDKKEYHITGLHRVWESSDFVLSTGQINNTLKVWNIHSCTPERTLTSLPTPRQIVMVDDVRAVVLCNRELVVYDLDSCHQVVKIRGQMNKDMPYFARHDGSHVVALSRNRMYLNMMNVATGDMDFTFKVGEDRFLNSLLVSKDGTFCVCGDETQKPFPLLVWNLTERRLVYHLAMQGYEFITRMAAITADAHYCACVCKEVDSGEDILNHIVIYDLRTGTVLKKLKPESNTCALAMSGEGDCVVTSMSTCHIIIWELSTGTNKFVLEGHTYPVNRLQLDDTGHRCVSYDSTNRDRSVRIWNLINGHCLTSLIPDEGISGLELMPGGSRLVVALPNHPHIITLVLSESEPSEHPDPPSYANPENKGKQISLN